MARSFHFPFSGPALTVETARAALCLWLEARRQNRPFTVSAEGDAPWRADLAWLGLEAKEEAGAGESSPWLPSLPLLEECSTPWGTWSGRTTVGELRELGVLPEALANFLALTAMESPAGEESFSLEEFVPHWSPARLRPGPVRFDFELLRRLNRDRLQRADPDRLVELSLPHYRRAGWLPEAELQPVVRTWLRDVIRVVLPGLDFLSLLPPRTRLVFAYDPENYLKFPESREALEREGARDVVRAFGQKLLEDNWITVERFRQIIEELRRETPWRGRQLHQPVQVALTGLPFGPALEELIPLFERGAELDLPARVKSCRVRMLEFCAVFV